MRSPPVEPVPVTDGDPPPYVPPAGEVAFTGVPVGLRSTGGNEQARVLALRMLEALLRGDQAAMTGLLAEQVVVTRPGRGRTVATRSDVVARMLHGPRRRNLGTDMPLEAIVDLSSVRIEPLRDRPALRAEGLRPEDWAVTFTFTPRGRRALFLLVEGWRHRGVVIVRTGDAPYVVGL